MKRYYIAADGKVYDENDNPIVSVDRITFGTVKERVDMGAKIATLLNAIEGRDLNEVIKAISKVKEAK